MLLFASSLELTNAIRRESLPNSITQQPVRDSSDPPQRRSSVKQQQSVPLSAANEATPIRDKCPRFVFASVVIPIVTVLDRSNNLVPVKLVGLRKAYG
jgi:hypothetical protein